MKKVKKFKSSWTKQLLNNSHIGILVVNEERKNLYVNKHLCDLFGYTQEELLQNDASIFHINQKSFQEFGEKAFEFVLEGKPVDLDYQFKKKDGTIFWIHISGDLIQNNKEVLWVVHDISNRKNLEEKYFTQAQFLDQIIDGILVTNFDHTVAYWNKGAERITKYKKEEVLGKDTEMFYKPEDLSKRKEIIKHIQDYGIYRGELEVIAKGGSIRLVELNASVLRDVNANPIGLVGYFKDISEKKEWQKQLEYEMHHDALTGLANRVLFQDRLFQAIKKAKSLQKLVALFFIDLDHFKQINESLGHDIGDRLLIEVTKKLKSTLKENESLARLGGDEFGIISENITSEHEASQVAQKILNTFNTPIEIDKHTFYITASIGISLFPNDGETIEDLLKNADAAMYKAKEEGRNNFQYYSKEMTESAFERVVLEAQLREAIKKKELIVYYQPQVNINDETISGAEALVRWKHPLLGIVSPDKFLPIAEATGLISEIDAYVMQNAMEQFKKWYNNGLNPGSLSLNITSVDLERENFVEEFQQMCKKIECHCENLELEITEGQIMKKPEQSKTILQKLRKLKIKIAIDDFGTGYSSLAYLKKFPITKLKIDQSFIRDMLKSDEEQAIVKAIIALAQALNLEIIAEGVEEKAQKELLAAYGCHKIQGYYYSPPVDAKTMELFLEKKVLSPRK